ncbi:isopeptide-forming domain-containing fimbrial protein [Microbacterium sp. NPDC056234]|uniref:DUF7507 domain-containing protein n=1 Tax=Microbacterium sp. NPDC056234 TaxID=3345757 RepID=UPI0035DC3458
MPQDVRRGRTRSLAMAVTALLTVSLLGVVAETIQAEPAAAVQDPTVCQGTVALENGGFEEPVVPAGKYSLLDESAVPGWLTTDVQNKIEIWSSGFNNVASAEGKQFAELNAYSASRLYQDVPTTPGQTLSWSLNHRGRQGTDVMRVLIGPPDAPVQNGPNLSDGLTWGSHAGTYVVPAGQTTTRFAFEAVTSVGGAGVGNLLDNITFGTGPCLISDKTVANITSAGTDAEVGDVLRYTVTTRNDGGNPAQQAVAADVLDPGLDFVSGSLRIVNGSGAGSLTDAAGDDRGEYDEAARTVRVRLGEQASATAGGSVLTGTTTTYSFDARVNVDAAGTTILNEAQVAFRDNVVAQDRVSTTQTTQTPVGDAADLAITKTLDTSPLVAGQPVAYTVVVTNNGPQASADFSVYDPIPASLSDVQAQTSSGSCLVTASVNCAGGPIGVGDEVEITITGTLSADAPAGSAVVNTAQVESSTTDPDQSNNTSTASGTVTAAVDVAIEKTFAPPTPIAGEEVVYTMVASNSGPSAAENVVITDPLDPATTFVSATSDAGDCDFDGSVVSCAIGTLAPGASVEATVIVTLAPDVDAAVQNTATITTSTSDGDATNNASSTSFDPTIVADLAVTKQASAATATAGDALTYTVDVTNVGPSVALNTVLTDTVPQGMTVQSVVAPPAATCAQTTTDVRCDFATLDPGQTETVTITVLVDADAPTGDLINTASVAAPADDADTTNNSASATVAVEQSADVGVEKTATPTTGVPGTAQSFTITVTNDGPSTARGVSVADILPDGFLEPTATIDGCRHTEFISDCFLGDIEPDGSVSFTIEGVIAPDATGSLTNSVTVGSATPDPNGDNYSDSVVVPLEPSADLSVTKTTSTPSVTLDGDVAYLITVRNDGPSTATGVVVADVVEDGITLVDAEASVGTWSIDGWMVGAMQPGAEETITLSAVATAEGTFTNTATGSAETADPDTDDLTGTAEVTVAASANLSIEKSASPASVEVGGQITYTLTVRNTGPNAATDMVISDPLPAELIDPTTSTPGCSFVGNEFRCEVAEFPSASGGELVYTATVDPATASTSVTNTATVSAATADPDTTDNTDSTTTPITGDGAIELTKTAGAPADADGDGAIGVGDEITYDFTVTNVGPTTATGVVIDDPLLGGPLACAALDGTTLDPTDAVDCGPYVYVLTQADVDAGEVLNTATVTADTPRGQITDDDSATVTVPGVSAVSLEKQAGDPSDADGDGVLGAGDTVDYTFTVTNTGTTTITDADIFDEMLGGAVICPELDGVVLAPDDAIECTPITYELTQDDVDAGTVHNEASVTANAAGGPATDTAQADISVEGSDAVELIKTAGVPTDADGDGRIGVGDEISYTFTVRNAGTTTLSVTAIDDPLLGGDTGCFADGAATLAPDAEVDCGPIVYELTQADIDAGVLDNTATVEAEGSIPVTDAGTARALIGGTTDVALTKSAAAPVDVNGDGMIGAGDEVAYSFAVTNIGTTTLTSAVVDDPLLGGALECPELAGLSLAPGDDAACGPMAYVLTQDDVDRGSVTNAATVAAASGTGSASDEATTDVAVVGTDGVALVKIAGAPTDADGDGRIGAGDEVSYSFTVTNTGTTTLTGAAIEDPLLGGALDCPDVAAATLAPGDAVECGPIVYVLTQADVDAATVQNTASVTASSPSASVTDDAEANATITAANGVSLSKTAGEPVDADGDGELGAGDTIDYSFTVTNTGTTTLTNIVVTDPMLGGAIECPDADGAALAPGASLACAAVTYTLTQDDVDGGVVSNTASVTAQAPTDAVEDSAQTESTIDGTDAIELTKTSGAVIDTTGDGLIGIGDEISYTFTVTNSGTRTVTGAVITDEKLGGELTCAALDGAEIAPGAAIDCGPYAYAITQQDIEAQVVHNDATVTADAASGTTMDAASADVVIAGTDGISLDKAGSAPIDADGDGRIGAGDEIGYTFTVRNTGTTVLNEVAIEDPLLGGDLDCPSLDGAELAPGEELVCGPVGYTLTQDDVDAQTVHNEATATAAGASGSVADAAVADVVVAGEDAIALVKSAAAIVDANGNGITDAGDTIDYTFAVTNTGTTTVTDPTISDARVDGDIECEATSIAPGEMVVCGPVTVALTQADVDAGEIVNTATASATGAGGVETTSDASVTTPIEAQPAVSVEKTGGDYADANGDAKVSAGDTVQFRFTVTNSGAATVTDVTIDDPKLGGAVACDIPELAPGESFTCGPVAYEITTDEAKARSVTNAATVTAISGASVVSASDSVTVDLPELAVTGGIVTGLGWAVLLIALGLLGMLIARIRRTRPV